MQNNYKNYCFFIKKEKIMELLAPAGNFEKLVTAVHFGADAVYFSGKKLGLRAFAGNFDEEEIFKAMEYLHNHNKILQK